MNRMDELEKYRKIIRQQEEFASFTDNEFEQLAQQMQVKTFAKGQVLFDQGDPRTRFYYVLDGVVRLERVDETGSFPFINYVSPHKAFPYRGMFVGETYTYAAMAMTAITIASFPMTVFEKLLRDNKQMMVCLISQMGQIIDDDENRLQRMVTSSATHRVKQALMLIAEDLGTQNESETTQIPYPITLKEVARVSGTTRETAGQVVSKLVDEGVVVYQHKNFQFTPELLT